MRGTTRIADRVAHLVGPGRLQVTNQRLTFRGRDQAPLQLSPADLESVSCYGDVGITDEALGLLFDHQVEVAWLTAAGFRCRGRLVGTRSSSVALRWLQFQILSSLPARLELARITVEDKIESQVRAARHYQRQGCRAAGPIGGRLRAMQRQCRAVSDLDAMRGVEGTSSAAWFKLLGNLLHAPWEFRKRVRRPPTDPVNALLSLGYTWLLNRTVAKLQATGLEAHLGALHEYRPGRPSLACDLIEPFRVPAVDRWVIALCNRAAVAHDHFVAHNDGIRLRPDQFARIMSSWERHWIEDGHDTETDRSIKRWIERLRNARSLVPGLSQNSEFEEVQAASQAGK